MSSSAASTCSLASKHTARLSCLNDTELGGRGLTHLTATLVADAHLTKQHCSKNAQAAGNEMRDEQADRMAFQQ